MYIFSYGTSHFCLEVKVSLIAGDLADTLKKSKFAKKSGRAPKKRECFAISCAGVHQSEVLICRFQCSKDRMLANSISSIWALHYHSRVSRLKCTATRLLSKVKIKNQVPPSFLRQFGRRVAFPGGGSAGQRHRCSPPGSIDRARFFIVRVNCMLNLII